MNQMEFNDIVKKLENLFKPMTFEQRSEYYEMFRTTYATDLKRTVDVLCKTHEAKYFPLPKQFWEVIYDIREERRRSSQQGSPEDYDSLNYCHKCQNSGLFIMELPPMENSQAFYCECQVGKSIKAAHQKNKNLRGQGTKVVNQKIPEIF